MATTSLYFAIGLPQKGLILPTSVENNFQIISTMGYELHIVRLDNYDDVDEESNISLEEWLAYVEADEELELNLGGQDGPGFCNLLGHPDSLGLDMPWFDFCKGSISAKNPDKYIIEKMLQIADSLNARVRNDDGEYYDETYFTNGGYSVEGNARYYGELPPPNLTTKKQWWKFW